MVFLPPAVSFCALKSIWSWVICERSDLRALTAAATALKRARASSSLDVSAVLRFTFLRRKRRLQFGFSVAATRWVPSSILLQLCCGLDPGLLNAPDTLSIPALHSTFAISRELSSYVFESLTISKGVLGCSRSPIRKTKFHVSGFLNESPSKLDERG